MPEETVTIKKSEYDQLVKDSNWLGYLDAAGVDNWQGIEYAIEMRKEDNAKADS